MIRKPAAGPRLRACRWRPMGTWSRLARTTAERHTGRVFSELDIHHDCERRAPSRSPGPTSSKIPATMDSRLHLSKSMTRSMPAMPRTSSCRLTRTQDASAGYSTPKVDRTGLLFGLCRGVAYYKVPDASGNCAERIFTNTIDARLIAIDARTGRPVVKGSARDGEVSLLDAMGEMSKGYYIPNIRAHACAWSANRQWRHTR